MMISKTDPRIEACGLPCTIAFGMATFTLPAPPERQDDAPTEVKVIVSGSQLMFFPERSSAQKRVLKAMGLTPE